MSDTTQTGQPRGQTVRANRQSARRQMLATSGRAATSKKAKLQALLARARGATLVQLQEELGWQPHTVRAAISGLRKAGHTIDLEETKTRKAYRLSV